MSRYLLLCLSLLGLNTVLADASLPRSAAPADAVVYLISPKAGEKVKGDVLVRFGLKGMGVAPAGVNLVGTGHHHLLVDVAELPDLNLPLPKDEHHLHFGAGQTETTLKLAPGKHTLQLILGDQLHIPHQPPVVSEKISFTVQ